METSEQGGLSLPVDTDEISVPEPVVPDTGKSGSESDSTLFTLRHYRSFNRIPKGQQGQDQRDSIFTDFLQGLPEFLDASNEQLYEDPAYEVYAASVYESSEEILPQWLRFKDSIRSIGLRVSAEEGVIYLREDPDFTELFLSGLDKHSKTFAQQYIRELRQPFWTDASIVVSVDEHVNRLNFWDRFSRSETDSRLRAYAYDRYRAYLFILMFGTDNTPIYRFGGESDIRPELLEAYRSLGEGSSESQAAPVMREYLLFLEEQAYRYESKAFGDYARRLFPDLAGE